MLKQLIKHVTEMETEERGRTLVSEFQDVPVYQNWLWSNQQRECHSLHEISYRACFKPQLPKFFIEHLSKRGHTVYDPFAGRGTTMVESLLAGRKAIFNDINPVCTAMAKGRVNIPKQEVVERMLSRLEPIDCVGNEMEDDLLAFYSRHTLEQINALVWAYHRKDNLDHPMNISKTPEEVEAMDWIRMVSMHLLTGHSDGYFSVRSLPPNQAVSAKRQRLLNEKHNNVPEAKDVVPRILKKSKSLMRDLDKLGCYKTRDVDFYQGDAASTPGIEDESVDLVVTSPPFLDVVDYKADNWLKAWFLAEDISKLRMRTSSKAKSWRTGMFSVFAELERVLKPGGIVAFEVGDIRGGKILMEDLVLQAAGGTYLEPHAILINDQDFTKTSKCWNVDNLNQGTNTNRIVLFEKA